jgi:hypothetical protein
MYNLKKLHPIYIKDLIRVGRNSDGGYVLSKQQIEKTEILLSFGINDEWSFEEDFTRFRRQDGKEINLYAYDASVSVEKFRHTSQHHFVNMLARLFTGNFRKANRNRQWWINDLRIINDFNSFFHPEAPHFFIPKFLGQRDDELHVRLDTLFKQLQLSKEISNLSVFIKMDIENWEYRTLPQLVPFFDKVNGLVVEFHELDITASKFEEVIDLFSSHFSIAHIHANNNGGLIHDTNLPMLLEITFINKDLAGETNKLLSHNYPIKGLDFPNVNMLDEIPLAFENQ